MKHPLRLLWIILLFSDCQKEPDNSSIIQINQQLSNYAFDIGSYWIYSDSFTNRIDSTYVFDVIRRDQFIGNSHSNSTFRMYRMVFGNFLNEQISYMDIVRNSIVFDFPRNIFENTFFQRFTTNSDSTVNHFRPQGIIENLNVKGEKYNRVFCYEIDSLSNQKSGSYFRLFMKDSIGIIKQQWYRNHQLYKQNELIRKSTNLRDEFPL